MFCSSKVCWSKITKQTDIYLSIIFCHVGWEKLAGGVSFIGSLGSKNLGQKEFHLHAYLFEVPAGTVAVNLGVKVNFLKAL